MNIQKLINELTLMKFPLQHIKSAMENIAAVIKAAKDGEVSEKQALQAIESIINETLPIIKKIMD